MSAYTKDPEFALDLWPDFLRLPPQDPDMLLLILAVALVWLMGWALMR